MRLVSATLLLLAALVCAPSWAVEYSERLWTDDEGKSISAKLLRLSGSTAILDQDGKIVRAPVNRLSDADQDWIKKVRELNRWREWTMIDGSKRRLKFENREGDDISLKEGTESIDVTLDQLSDADRELLAEIFDTAPQAQPAFGGPSLQGAAPSGITAENLKQGKGLPNFPGTGEVRDWTNVNGKKIEAEYRGVKDGQIVLYFKNREWEVPAKQFVQADQEWVFSRIMQQLEAASEQAMSDMESQIASSGGNGFDAARNEIQGRMNPGLNSGGFNSGGGFHSGGVASASQMHNDAMARHDEMRQRMEQDRLERQRRDEERFAEMRRQQEEQMARREQERRERLASMPSTPSHSPPSAGESFSPGPPMHEPTFPTSAPAAPGSEMVMMNEYKCFSCNHTWQTTQEMGAGDKCPKCGVTFDYMEDEHGKIVEETSTGKAKRYGGIIKLVIFAVMAVGGLLAKFSR